jgi:hypothetical protein
LAFPKPTLSSVWREDVELGEDEMPTDKTAGPVLFDSLDGAVGLPTAIDVRSALGDLIGVTEDFRDIFRAPIDRLAGLEVLYAPPAPTEFLARLKDFATSWGWFSIPTHGTARTKPKVAGFFESYRKWFEGISAIVDIHELIETARQLERTQSEAARQRVLERVWIHPEAARFSIGFTGRFWGKSTQEWQLLRAANKLSALELSRLVRVSVADTLTTLLSNKVGVQFHGLDASTVKAPHPSRRYFSYRTSTLSGLLYRQLADDLVGRQTKERFCKQCGKHFVLGSTSKKVFCSDSCRSLYRYHELRREKTS